VAENAGVRPKLRANSQKPPSFYDKISSAISLDIPAIIDRIPGTFAGFV
jgi:hypothetical protein